MEQTFTETAESNASLLSGWRVTNYNSAQLNSLMGGLTLAFSTPTLENTARATMYASETILSREWASPEEDQAWVDL